MMKKLFFIALLALMILPLIACGTFRSVRAEESEVKPRITDDEIKVLTKEICEEIKDRTSFVDETEGGKGKAAADWICERLLKCGLNAEVQLFTAKRQVYENFFSTTVKEYVSYNVVASTEQSRDKKTVLITTNYSNHYSDNPVMSGTGAEGALGTAATTALTLKLAEYFAANETDYNVKFAFFSATDEGNFGSRSFVENNSISDVIFVINLERLGGGDTYYYTDEAPTSHGKLVAEIAKGYEFKAFPEAGRVLLEGSTVDGLDYVHYAISGDNATFMSQNKACLELIGGKFTGLKHSDGKGYATNTEYDTLENLETVYPDYAVSLSEVGEFIIELTSAPNLSEVCNGAAQGYKVFTESWIAYVICLGILVILILILILVSGHLEKKYPLPRMPKIKIAVFGSEYEEASDNEIIVDIKHNNDDIDPFDGK